MVRVSQLHLQLLFAEFRLAGSLPQRKPSFTESAQLRIASRVDSSSENAADGACSR